MPITADKRGYVAGKYGIELDGIMAGWIRSEPGLGSAGAGRHTVVMQKYVIIGAQGSGKGTQSGLLAKHLDLVSD